MAIQIDTSGLADLPQGLYELLSAAIDLSTPKVCMQNHVQPARSGFVLDRQYIHAAGRIILVSIGKAADSMAASFLKVSRLRIDKGMIIGKHTSLETHPLPENIKIRLGDHPVPGMNSIRSTQELITMINGLTERDTLICLISGGGSALMTFPQPGISLEDIQETTRTFLACGARIDEINCIRKHLDMVKGGGLLRLAQPAQVVSIILSDVVGSPLDVIASGPTTPDPTTFSQARDIIAKYRVEGLLPQSVRDLIEKGVAGTVPETLKPNQAISMRAFTSIIGSNRQTALGLVAVARKHGYISELITSYLQGEASEAGTYLASIAHEVHENGNPLPKPCCLVFGGETTVTLRGQGHGGRNLELALAAAQEISGLRGTVIAALATDGEDGPTDAAGAIVTDATRSYGSRGGYEIIRFLKNNDAYRYFEKVGGLITTGPTGTNVNDLALLICY